MGLSEKEKFEIRKVIKANKWYTFEEAESDLRKHWQPENDKNGDYLSMKRSQIQKILRSDILGTYLEINKRKKDQSDDEWFIQTIYGWSKKEKFFWIIAMVEKKNIMKNCMCFQNMINCLLNLN